MYLLKLAPAPARKPADAGKPTGAMRLGGEASGLPYFFRSGPFQTVAVRIY